MPRIAAPLRWRLREATEADRPFLRALYADTHAGDFAGVGLPEETQATLLGHQFAAREASYASSGARSTIVLVDDRPAGRLLVATQHADMCVVDIALLRQHQRRGIGTALVAEVVAEATRAGLPITLHVEKGNPARHLYDRLGFVPVGEDPFRVRMRREPAADPENGAGHD